MKPLQLTMSAFGSFADVQKIDFTELGVKGLYLIAGETGAGKTTIFDAISFALFGKASGDGRGDYVMLRSDFAEEKAKTYVALDFVSGGMCYTIRRTIKKTGGQDVVLILPDGTKMNGDRHIKTQIAEIVGLDRGQFAQIVMIAQNDFLRFLQSGTEERVKILRRIFGTEVLRFFQARLKTLERHEYDKRQLILHDFARYEVDVYQREGCFAEWEARIRDDQGELLEVDGQLSRCDKQKQNLAAGLAVAGELSRKFDALSQSRLELEEHQAKAQERSAAETRARYGAIALYQVKPLADEARKAAARHTAAQDALTEAKEQEDAAVTELAEAAAAVTVLPSLAEAREAFTRLSQERETVAARLKRLTDLQADSDDIVRKQKELNEAQQGLTATIEALNALPPVEHLQTTLGAMAEELKVYEDKQEKLVSLQRDSAVIADKQSQLAKEQEVFEGLNTGFMDTETRYRMLEEAFLRNQAGIIAGGLKTGRPCPVCGSICHPAPAQLSDGDADGMKLKKAREKKENAQAKRNSQSEKCSMLHREIEILKERLAADIFVIMPGAGRCS